MNRNRQTKEILESLEAFNVKLLRTILGTAGQPMTHSELEVESGIGRSTLQRWEAAWKKPKPKGRRFKTYPTITNYQEYLQENRRAIERKLKTAPASRMQYLHELTERK